MPVIQALPRIAGHDRRPAADASSRATIRPSNVEPIAEACVIASPTRHQPAGVQRGHPGREPGAGRRAVEPARRDDDGVSADRADALPRLGDLDDADAGDVGVLGVGAGELLARRGPDPLAGQRQVARLARLDREAERGGVGDRVPHAAVGDVDRERAEALDLERRVEPVGERGDVRDLDALAAAVAARGPGLDDAARRLEPQHRLGLAHLDHAGLEQHGRGADRVRARHGRVLGRLHDDEAGVAVGPRRRHDQVRVAGDAAARLVQEQLAQAVAVARAASASARTRSRPAGGSTPPVTTFPTSPPAWHPTTVIVRRARIGASIPGLTNE